MGDPEMPLTAQEFLQALPKSVIANGAVIDVRGGVAGLLKGSSSAPDGTPGVVVAQTEGTLARERLVLSLFLVVISILFQSWLRCKIAQLLLTMSRHFGLVFVVLKPFRRLSQAQSVLLLSR
jgi:hypothetical protein